MDIWQECKEQAVYQTLNGNLIRVVESQEQIATNNLVATLDEQHLLEEMLEGNKPRGQTQQQHLHYLLATPFRYPPLRHGSRFGKRSEPSLFYGSLTLTTALSETAYYRFMFWRGMAEPPPSKKFTTQHTVFGATYWTDKGYSLRSKPFDQYHAQLSDPRSYQASQALGTQLRAAEAEAIESVSARDQQKGINIALFSASALTCRSPSFQQQWLCETDAAKVAFYSVSKRAFHQFPLAEFMVDGEFPIPES